MFLTPRNWLLYTLIFTVSVAFAAQNDEIAKLRLATEQGHSYAQYQLGEMYEFGQGVSQNYVSAYMHYNLAAANDVKGARLQRDGLATKMTAGQIAEAQCRARNWAPKPWEELQGRANE